MPHRREFVARRAIAKLGLVAKGEQRLVAARRLGRARDAENFVDGQEGAFPCAGRLCEDAIMADIAAQSGQRDESLGREGDGVAMGEIAPRRRRRHHGAKIVIDGEPERRRTAKPAPCR